MTKKNRIYIIITGIMAITLIWLSQGNGNQMPDLKSQSEENISNNTENEPVGTFEGTLWMSDNSAKGNLMLATDNATIYIRTSRDFGGLVGKRVVASIDGTLDNFTLLNIEENLSENGFIKAQ